MHTAIQNAYEKEIETLLSSSNTIITRQKEALTHAQEGEAWKSKIRQLEQQHIEEKFQADYRCELKGLDSIDRTDVATKWSQNILRQRFYR